MFSPGLDGNYGRSEDWGLRLEGGKECGIPAHPSAGGETSPGSSSSLLPGKGENPPAPILCCDSDISTDERSDLSLCLLRG